MGSHYRNEEGICAKEEKDILAIKRRKGRGT